MSNADGHEMSNCSVELTFNADGLDLRIDPDDGRGPFIATIARTDLLRALSPVTLEVAAAARTAEAERIAEVLHAGRFDVERGLRDVADSFLAGMRTAEQIACTGAHPGSLHAEASRAAAARAALTDFPVAGAADLERLNRSVRTAMAQVAALADRTGKRPSGWNEAISEVSLLLAETVVLMPEIDGL
ncbi:hypothetical protein CHO01_29050 [Cellulomonas hominis]|uniref:Cation transporter-like permease n=1 Tax=Cellulomonas hominis TaxID=156981 RepID=A0A511FEW1_9CELL|nr:hypothetical protein [Cellulomonas hominis]MBB5474746.1 cation transporter-like permease [Cellulomonas hominis]NKY05402.1 hypothetical protein [Cellulomonas hominis]GEL47789.1 hypothetical protein CHO01_29050 [Cellulomonas hominis]